MSKPIAVLISDIHFSLATLELASAALTQAVSMSNNLRLPLIVAGDIHDQKANIRGECVKAIMDILEKCHEKPYVIVANHDRINEKSKEHSLEFLRNTVHLVTEPTEFLSLTLLPYYHDLSELRAHLREIEPGSTLIMHQGIQGSDAGHYIQDPTALQHVDVARFNVISGHYHRRQTIKTGFGKTWNYIGNPYSLNFGEANDPEKGFRILNDDGTLDFVPTKLRKHIVFEGDQQNPLAGFYASSEDLVWVKLTGTKEWLSSINKDQYKGMRLDLIPLDTESKPNEIKTLTQHELLDSIIDNTQNTPDQVKTRVKQLWRKLL
jgi:hypothetical protein